MKFSTHVDISVATLLLPTNFTDVLGTPTPWRTGTTEGELHLANLLGVISNETGELKVYFLTILPSFVNQVPPGRNAGEINFLGDHTNQPGARTVERREHDNHKQN